MTKLSSYITSTQLHSQLKWKLKYMNPMFTPLYSLDSVIAVCLTRQAEISDKTFALIFLYTKSRASQFPNSLSKTFNKWKGSTLLTAHSIWS